MEADSRLKKEGDPLTTLGQSIINLREQRANEKEMIVSQLQKVVHPSNWLAESSTGPIITPGLSEYMLNASIGLTVGYLAKLILVGNSRNPAKRMIGNAVMVALTNAVLKNPEAIKSIGMNVYHFIKKLRDQRSVREQEN